MRDTDPVGEPDNPADLATGHWETVIEDMAATADEYRERGWTAIEIHPGDVEVAARDAEHPGIQLLAPDDEFDRAAAAMDETEGFADAEVFRAMGGGTLYLVAALEAADTETVVLLPAYYAPANSDEFVQMLHQEGEVDIHVRPLDQRRVLTFSSSDVSLFLPPENE